ncbi:MAG: TetR/AcrR family transcriptional regulator [Oscillospiraceae bacterium]|jgi:AcrR family transcriptional regulator|nr:TetR/AcrR family transcriptional regulator [Oscillospiraceae bacterium]
MQLLNKTKQSIVSHSITLFSEKGYENVSIRNIADAVKIKPASIYNHFESKESILDHIYNYYVQNCFNERLTPAEYMPILRTGSAVDIISILNYGFKDPIIMFNVTRILWARKYIDPVAKKVYKECVIDAGMTYIVEVIAKGIELRRIDMKPENIQTFASLVLSSRVFAANAIVIDPDRDKWRHSETAMLELLSGLLTLNAPLPA